MPNEFAYRPPKKLRKATDEMDSMWLSETQEYRDLVGSILSALPGSEPLEEFYKPPAPIGWLELDLMGKLFDAIETKEDIEYVVRTLYPDLFEEERENRRRKRSRR